MQKSIKNFNLKHSAANFKDCRSKLNSIKPEKCYEVY